MEAGGDAGFPLLNATTLAAGGASPDAGGSLEL